MKRKVLFKFPKNKIKANLQQPESYQLPDGQIIKLGYERFKSAELLFHPELIGSEYPGVHQLVLDSIQSSDIDLRKTLYSNVVLSGILFYFLNSFYRWINVI